MEHYLAILMEIFITKNKYLHTIFKCILQNWSSVVYTCVQGVTVCGVA